MLAPFAKALTSLTSPTLTSLTLTSLTSLIRYVMSSKAVPVDVPNAPNVRDSNVPVDVANVHNVPSITSLL